MVLYNFHEKSNYFNKKRNTILKGLCSIVLPQHLSLLASTLTVCGIFIQKHFLYVLAYVYLLSPPFLEFSGKLLIYMLHIQKSTQSIKCSA